MTTGGSASGGGATAFGSVGPRDLVEARLQLHHAALLTSAVGRGLGRRQRGYRQAALFSDHDRQALVGADIEAPDGTTMRAELALDPPALAFVRHDGGADPAWRQPLHDVTFDAAWQGIRSAAASSGLAADTLPLPMPKDLPDHPLRTGATFAIDPACGVALAAWFDYADRLLADVARRNDSPLPVPCWGDHFDMAVSVGLAEDSSITLGFSPGDGSTPEPYFYVLPWPVPGTGRLPGAPVNARWQTKGWVGLVLEGLTVVAQPDPDAAGRAFLQEGFDIVQDLLLSTP